MSASPASHSALLQRSVPTAGGYRWLLPALCAALGLALALGNPNYHWSDVRDVPYGADFLQEWVAGDMLLQGSADSIYDAEAFARWQHDAKRVGFEWPDSQFYPAVYPPPYYVLVTPLAMLPYQAAALVWLGALLTAYSAALWLAQRSVPRNADERIARERTQPSVLVRVLLFPALFMSLVMGQKGTLWLLIVVASWQMWREDRSFTAGCIWGLLTVKPTLCCWLPLIMLACRQWRFVGGAAFSTVVLWGLTALVVPVSLWSDFGSIVLSGGSYQEHAGYRNAWSASMLTVFTALGLPRSIRLMLWAGIGALMIVSLIVLPRRAATCERLRHPEFLLRVLLATALLSPHFYFYDLVWLIFPLGRLLDLNPRRALSYMAILWLGMLLAQQYETGWPVLGIGLLGIFAHSTAAAMGCLRSSGACRSQPAGMLPA